MKLLWTASFAEAARGQRPDREVFFIPLKIPEPLKYDGLVLLIV